MLDQRHQEGELGQQTQAQLASSAPAASVAGSRTLPPSIVDDDDEEALFRQANSAFCAITG